MSKVSFRPEVVQRESNVVAFANGVSELLKIKEEKNMNIGAIIIAALVVGGSGILLGLFRSEEHTSELQSPS